MQPKHDGVNSGIGADERADSAFPYDSYKGEKIWRVVEKAMQDLVENHDIVETTHRDYIVGYICKMLEQQ